MGCLSSQPSSSTSLQPLSKAQPATATEGTLANEQLIADTTSTLARNTGIAPNTKIAKFVVQPPVGEIGSRAWREIWVVDPEGLAVAYAITFQEANGGADFAIHPMKRR